LDDDVTPKRFPSKIDTWLLILLIAAILVQVVAMIFVLLENNDQRAMIIMIATTFLLVALIGSVISRTYYSIEGPTLRIVSGPFRWKVPVDQIKSIEATRNPLSSPALSLDRLKIIWGNNKKVMVSPVDKKAFAKALGVELDR
jgi:hypothetical protein